MSGPGAGVAGMMSDGSNATLPNARSNLGLESAAKCDNVTDDTATLQAEITALTTAAGSNSNRKLVLPAGRCLVSNISITKPLTIIGQGQKQTSLVSPNGSTNPAFTVAVDNNWGFNPAIVQFQDLSIRGESKTDAPGVGVAHGIKLTGTGVGTILSLLNVTIDETPGACLYQSGGANASSVQGYNFNCMLSGWHGLYANGAYDWVFIGGQIYGATLYNIACGGCGNFHFKDVNNYSAEQRNIDIFYAAGSSPTSFWWDGGSIDRAFQTGINIDNRARSTVYFTNVTIGFSGSSANLTYSDMNLSALNTGDVYLDNVLFYDKSLPAGNKAKSNINITTGGTGTIYAKQTVFDAGTWQTSGVLTDLWTLYKGDEPIRSWTPTVTGSTGGTATLTTALGSFTTNKGKVTLWGHVLTSSTAGLTGNLLISNLPVFPVNDVGNDGMCSIPSFSGWTAPANFSGIGGIINGSSGSFINIFRNPTNGGNTTATAVGEWASLNSRIKFFCEYRY